MRLAALILVHHYPLQGAKLIHILLQNDLDVFVHVDARAQATYNELYSLFKKEVRVTFTKERHKVYWGSFSQVLATLALLKCARQQNTYDYYTLLSGQDLPIQPLSDYRDFLEKNKGREFIHWYKLPHFENHGISGGLERMELYWLDIKPRFTYLRAKLTDLIQKAQKRLKHKRKFDFELYSGSNWFTLSGSAIDYCLSFLQEHPSFARHFRYTRCTDEIFFQTLLLNSPFSEKIQNENLRYIDWQSGPEYPRVLRLEDLDKIKKASHKFFGRKFDLNLDSQIIEILAPSGK